MVRKWVRIIRSLDRLSRNRHCRAVSPSFSLCLTSPCSVCLLPFLSFAFLLLLLLSLGLAPSGLGADNVTLQLKWDHEFQFAGYYAAQWQGYYEAAGLNVTIRSRVTPDGKLLDVGDELQRGNAEFAVAGPDLLIYRDRGIPVIILATIFQKSPYAFVAVKGHFKTPAQFAGKRVNQTEPTWGPVELDAVMRAAGADPRSIIVNTEPPNLGLLVEGHVDIIATYLTSATWQMKEMNTEFDTFTADDFGVHLYGDTLIAHERMITSHPRLVERFTQASLEGWKYALEHSDEIADKIAADLPRTYRFYRDFAAYNRHEAKDVLDLTQYPTVALGYSSRDRWERTLDYFRQSGYVSQELDIDNLIYQPEQRLRKKIKRITITLVSVGAVGSLLVLLLAGWSYTLRAQVTAKTSELQALTHSLEERVRERTDALQHEFAIRQRLESRLIQSHKMEALGTLAGGIAHDFNNLLTAILGNISLAQLKIAEEDPIYPFLTRAVDACQRAHELPRQLLTFAKGGSPIKKVLAIDPLVREILSLTTRGLKSAYRYNNSDKSLCAEIDGGQISQVLQNLLINADQAMPAGGNIRVTVDEYIATGEDAPLTTKQRYVRISVHDEGIGIPKENQDKIFEPFFTTKDKGHGLGLSISFSIVKNHHGLLTLESIPGAGTTFYVFLPTAETPPEQEDGLHAEHVRCQGKILVMDDDEEIREIAARTISDMGGTVDCVANGAEAIHCFSEAKAEGKPYDLVILDLTIRGGMGGKETNERLRELDPKVKTIVMSGYSNDPIMANCHRYGFVGMITKPFVVSKLARAVADALKE